MSIRVSKLALGLVTALTMSMAVSAAGQSNEEIQKRIQPVGGVYLASAVAEVAAEPAGPRSGEQVYQASCFGCHGTGAAGAPKYGDAAAWGPRKAQGIETLFSHALNGFNAMPPKGTCMSCSDDELKSAIEYMTNAI
ncbi:MAG: cytochrome c5 family protein [Gammaproteobacteria bacterium]|nr:cytochrome c5 family protein [Gammaproteobacteria bacterium]